MGEGEKSCSTRRSVVLKDSSTRIMGYSSFDNVNNSWYFCKKSISKEHKDNIPLISREDPDSLSNPNQLEEDRYDSSGSTGSDDSYYSCDSNIPSKKNKEVFFNILKHLLEDQSILQEGDKEERWCDNTKLKLKYMGRKCKAVILDGEGKEIWERIMETKYIYLNWRGDVVEPLSLENLQTVQNKLKFLGIQSKKVCDCFSLARTQLMEEPNWVQENMKLKIICCEVILTFGKGKNLAIVLYDDIEKIPKYYMEMAHWYTKLFGKLGFLSACLVTVYRRACIFFSDIRFFSKYYCQLLSMCRKYKQL